MMLETLDEPVLNTEAQPVPPPMALIQMLFGKHITYCISAVARLGVADHMAAGPVPIERLAENTASHALSLYGVMRCRASLEGSEEFSGERCALKPIGDLLRTDNPNSM